MSLWEMWKRLSFPTKLQEIKGLMTKFIDIVIYILNRFLIKVE